MNGNFFALVFMYELFSDVQHFLNCMVGWDDIVGFGGLGLEGGKVVWCVDNIMHPLCVCVGVYMISRAFSKPLFCTKHLRCVNISLLAQDIHV